MPVRPILRNYYCSACNWSKTVVPDSDVLMPGFDHFDACPRCGQALSPVPPQASLESGLIEVLNTLEKWFKR